MSSTADLRVAERAARTHGLITPGRGVRCGLSPGQLHRRLAAGHLVVVAPAVYRVAAAPVTWRQIALAATLAGPAGRTVVSHLTAAALLELRRVPTSPHVTLPPGTSGRIRLARVHRSTLSGLDRITIDGVPTTSAARTLLDCAGIVRFSALCDLVDTAFCAGICHAVVIPAAIERAQAGRGKKGVAALRAAIEAWTPGITPGSAAEMRLLRKITEAGLEQPERQIEIYDAEGTFIGRIDLGWRSLRAGFEYDSDRSTTPASGVATNPVTLGTGVPGWEVRRVGKYDLLPSVTWLDDHLRLLRRRLVA